MENSLFEFKDTLLPENLCSLVKDEDVICFDSEGKKTNFVFDAKFLNQSKDSLVYVKKEWLSDKKKNLCFYIGYNQIYDEKGKIDKKNYGSEIMCMKMVKFFQKDYNIFVLNASNVPYLQKINGVFHGSVEYFSSLNLSTEILIISRYIQYFIEYDLKPVKTFLWLHDVTLAHHYKSIPLPLFGKNLLSHVEKKIDKIICLSEWHREYFLSIYGDILPDPKKVIVINYGIFNSEYSVDLSSFAKKKKFRFIWTSDFSRGIEKTILLFHKIQQHLPSAELHIYRDTTGYIDLIRKYSSKKVFFHGKVSNEEILKAFEISDVWFYPTDFYETFCLSALEAQRSGVLCICSNLAALQNTVSDRGLTFHSEEKEEEIIQMVVEYLQQDEETLNQIRKKAYVWARNQDWSNIGKKWRQIFEE